MPPLPTTWDLNNVFAYVISVIAFCDAWLNGVSPVLSICLKVIIASSLLSVVLCYIVNFDLSKRDESPDGLYYAYFGGSGLAHFGEMHGEALKTIYTDVVPFSFHELAHYVADIEVPSRIVAFLLCFIYVPVKIVGTLDYVIRCILGTIIVAVLYVANFAFLLVFSTLYSLMIIPLSLIDRALRKRQRCHSCYSQTDLPKFKCPKCGKMHSALKPARTGLFFSRCSCGEGLMSASVISGRDDEDAYCPSCDAHMHDIDKREHAVAVLGRYADTMLVMSDIVEKLSEHGASWQHSDIVAKYSDIDALTLSTIESRRLVLSIYRPNKNPRIVVANGAWNKNDKTVLYEVPFDYLPTDQDSEKRLEKYNLGFLRYVGAMMLVIRNSGDYYDNSVGDIIQRMHAMSGLKASAMIRTPLYIVVCADVNGNSDEIRKHLIKHAAMQNLVDIIDSSFSNVTYISADSIETDDVASSDSIVRKLACGRSV